MSAKTKEYLKAGIIVLILILLIFTFNLPKDILFNLAIIIPIVIFLNEVFPHKNKTKGGRKREYITAILFFLIFATLTFIFDLPKKLYFFFGITAVSFIILYELFNLKNDKENTA
ncbi:hypothetical protein GCM10009001_20390 [Virgibacillus siamensis]|uniref:Uncharacterized protein n=1 Tax=Virgibacillus siamensis TaxID=480071 RepID=A0ABP3R615_9BACI